MAANDRERNRLVVPRWRPFVASIGTGELGIASSIQLPSNLPSIEQQRLAWERNPSDFTRGDLISSALVAGREAELHEVASALEEHESITSSLRHIVRVAAGAQLHATAELDLRGRIRDLKGRLRINPRSAPAWLDLALCYTALGQPGKAIVPVDLAISQGRDVRWIVRSVSRYFLHIGRPDKAHDVILRCASTKSDPWLLAAEISIASIANTTSNNVRIARRMLESGDHADRELSELASAVATMEHWNGANSKRNKLIRLSLKDPTENSLAQAAWFGKEGVGIDLETQRLATSPEAGALFHRENNNLDLAIDACDSWLNDQPFSSAPAIMGSFLASRTMRRHADVVGFAQRGLVASPHNVNLLNNHAFGLIQCGELDRAASSLEKARTLAIHSPDRITVTATGGLLAFRRGFINEGRKLYLDAIALAKSSGDPYRQRIAICYLALEELSLGADKSNPIVEAALAAAKELHTIEDGSLVEELRRRANSVAQ